MATILDIPKLEDGKSHTFEDYNKKACDYVVHFVDGTCVLMSKDAFNAFYEIVIHREHAEFIIFDGGAVNVANITWIEAMNSPSEIVHTPMVETLPTRTEIW